MKKSNFTGWKDVFKFTFIQDMKNKATIIFTAILFAIAALALPIISLISGDEKKEEKSSIEKVYVVNEIGINIIDAIKTVNKDTEFSEIEYEEVSDMKETEEKLDSDKNSKKAMLMKFSLNDEGYYDLQLEYSEKGKLSEEDLDALSFAISNNFSKIMSIALGITDEQMQFVNTKVITEVLEYTGEIEDTSDEEADVLDMHQYSFLLTIISIMAFVISLSGSSVATAIITEKSSKIIEFLLTSIKPMAIVVGKVLATMCVILVEILSMIIGLLVSFVINSKLNGISIKESANDTFGSFINTEVLSGAGVINIVMGIVAICLGLILFGMVAGLVGATVNKLEEAAEGLKGYNFAMIIGAYITIAVAMMGMSGGIDEVIVRIVCIFPLSAPFALPGFTLIGMIDTVSIAISIIIMIVCIVLVTIFTANVYEEIIYHNGEPMKIRDIVRIYKNNKRGVNENEK